MFDDISDILKEPPVSPNPQVMHYIATHKNLNWDYAMVVNRFLPFMTQKFIEQIWTKLDNILKWKVICYVSRNSKFSSEFVRSLNSPAFETWVIEYFKF